MADIGEKLTAPGLCFLLRRKRNRQFRGSGCDLLLQRLTRLPLSCAMG